MDGQRRDVVSSENVLRRRADLPVILIAAVVQGWALYALHASILGKFWPATQPAALLAFYAIAALIPITIQRLAGFMRDRTTWVFIALLSVLFFYFGWHHGAHVIDLSDDRPDFPMQWFAFAMVLVVLWLMVMPFLQARLETGRWRVHYATLFANAWNNKLVLAEAVAFTGAFWLLLMLMQQLFFMLGISFFRELFAEPVFIYPVTSITFGVALHLIGSLERLTKLVLDQTLNVLKWLGLLAGIILTLFTVALIAKLPGMVASGDRAIGAAWLLWLIAMLVLLVNAAYRDGSVANPYPRAIGIALRLVVPLTVIVALTALYAMYLRIDRYGFTVDRVWACIVAVCACVYSVGYTFAARDKQQWMAGIGRVNVIAALFLMAVLALTLTPLLSPYRIAAGSQFAKIINDLPATTANRMDNPFMYLRMSAGDYGRQRLQQLAKLENHPQAATIREDANSALEMQSLARVRALPSRVEHSLQSMTLHPKGSVIDPELMIALHSHLSKPEFAWLFQGSNESFFGVYADLDGNDADEFVLVSTFFADVFERREQEWQRSARLQANPQRQTDWGDAIERGAIRIVEPKWKDLQIGNQTFRFVEQR
jgi:hypothetical protein